MRHSYLKFALWMAVTLAGLLLFFNLLAWLLKPSLPKKFVMPSTERIAVVEQLRAAVSGNPPVINQPVDYSQGKSAAWYPKGQAPILKELVDEGKLPPLSERVPCEPAVLAGVDHVHNYGGTWMRLGGHAGEIYSISNRLGYAHLLRWSPLGEPIVPHVAKSFAVSEDDRVFTFELRKGMKWSDGHPFTTDDIKYFWENEENEKMLCSAPSEVFRFRGNVARFEFIDDYKFRIVFTEPNGLFLAKIAGAYGRWICNSPAHFLTRFHPVLGDQELIAKLQGKYGLPSKKAVYYRIKEVTNPELPRITPWIIKRPIQGSLSEAVRNPYYWCVDPEGNQLPYLDRIIFTNRSSDMITLSAASGEVSMQNKFIDRSQYTLLMENAEKGDYELYHWYSAMKQNFPIVFNMEYKADPAKPAAKWKKNLLDSKDFRKALSVALNRQRIIDSEFNGMVEAAQIAPGRNSFYFHESAFKAATEYNPLAAEKLLDGLRLTKRDGEGYRTFPDGSRMSFFLSVSGTSEIQQFLIDDWRQVGVRVIVRVLGAQLLLSRIAAGEAEIFSWGSMDFFPVRPALSFAPGATKWYEAGGMFGSQEAAVYSHKAPAEGSDLYKFFAHYSAAANYSTLEKRKFHMDKMLELMAANLWWIDIATPMPELAVVKNGFRNVPRKLDFSWSYQSPANGGVETFCWDREYLRKPKIASMEQAAWESIKYQIVNTATDPPSDSTVVGNTLPAGTPSLHHTGGGRMTMAFTIVKYLLLAIAVALGVMAALKHPYVLRRLILMIPTLLVISIVVFVVIQLPEGDYIDSRIAALAEQGEQLDIQEVEQLKEMFFINESMPRRYARWMGFKWFITFDREARGLLQGHMGRSMQNMRVVNSLIAERVLLTFCISLGTLLLTWAIAFPIGIYSAVKQYSVGDYAFTIFGFLGMSVPGFILCLLMMYFCERYFGFTPTGLFSAEFGARPDWSFGKIVDLLKHIWIPIMIMGVGGTAGMIRVMRANLLDELKKPYVVTARAKGVTPMKLLFKYPVRMALNPFVSGIGGIFPMLVSGGSIVAIVMSLPTVGPLLLDALMVQDMYMAGSLIMFFSLLGIFGVLVSDILLLMLDPRIRFEGSSR